MSLMDTRRFVNFRLPVYEQRALLVLLRGYSAAQQRREERVRRPRPCAHRGATDGVAVDEGLSGGGEVDAAHVEVHDLGGGRVRRRGGGGGGFAESRLNALGEKINVIQ